MKPHSNTLLFSASDIVNFLACRPLTALDCVNLNTALPSAEDDRSTKLLQDKGFAHESAFIKKLRSEGKQIIEIPEKGSLEERARLTIDAMKSGEEIIFQAAFLQAPWMGYADFLIRCDTPSNLGIFSYEVSDTKLARQVSPKFLVQLAYYNQLLAGVQGRLGQKVHVILGNNQIESFYASEMDGYISLAKERFVAHVQELKSLNNLDQAWKHPILPYPVPCEKCKLCRWREICEDKRLADDHLSQVANIRKSQISKLENAGIKTMAKLANLHTAKPIRIPGMVDTIQNKLAHQAVLQLDEKNSGKQDFTLLPPFDHPANPDPIKKVGLNLLPKSDPGDLFFDMEGNPLEEGGLEYLFGVAYTHKGKTEFRAFWAHNRAEEKLAFENFVVFALERIAKFPSAHIYHYASYEVTAMRRLASTHGTREKEIDDLLRQERFVDLFKVVRDSLLISKDNYSIKSVESFYFPKRGGEVKKGDESIVVYEEWKVSQDPSLLKNIENYNREDCISTLQLRDWLLKIAPPWIPAKAGPGTLAVADTEEPPRPRSERSLQEEAERSALMERIKPFALGSTPSPIADSSVFGLVAQLLAFHARERKPVWWSIYDRQGTELEDLLTDEEVIAGCKVGSVDNEDGMTAQFHYPEQDFRIKNGDSVKILSSWPMEKSFKWTSPAAPSRLILGSR